MVLLINTLTEHVLHPAELLVSMFVHFDAEANCILPSLSSPVSVSLHLFIQTPPTPHLFTITLFSQYGSVLGSSAASSGGWSSLVQPGGVGVVAGVVLSTEAPKYSASDLRWITHLCHHIKDT